MSTPSKRGVGLDSTGGLRCSQTMSANGQFSGLVEGISVSEIAFSFLVLLSSISFFLAFSILSSAKFAVTATDDQTYTGPDGNPVEVQMTEKLTLKYDKFASLEFTMIISVLEWIFTVVLILVFLVTQLSDSYKIPVWVKGGLKRGCAVAVFFGYTAALAVGAMSTSCNAGNGVTISTYESATIQDEISSFCSKVGATCTFVWLGTIAMAGGIGLKYRAGSFNDDDVAFAYGTEGSDPNYSPSSAYDVAHGVDEEASAGAFHESPEKAASGGGGYKADETGGRNSFASGTPSVVSSADL